MESNYTEGEIVKVGLQDGMYIIGKVVGFQRFSVGTYLAVDIDVKRSSLVDYPFSCIITPEEFVEPLAENVIHVDFRPDIETEE